MDELPRIGIRSVADGRCHCTFEPFKGVGNDRSVCLLVAGGVVWGTFRAVDVENRTAILELESVDGSAALVAGGSYQFLDGYWGQRAEVVVDEHRTWTPRRFVPTDALEYFVDGRRMTTNVRDDAPPGGHLIEAAWDHEHCRVCDATISAVENTDAWSSSFGDWVCDRCYRAFVIPRSLDFVGRDLDASL